MDPYQLEQSVRRIVQRAESGFEPHGIRLELLSLVDGIARLRLYSSEVDHTCGHCDVQVPIALSYLVQDLRALEGVRDVDLR